MSFQKILELQDYIQNKLADLETAKDGSLEQFIKNVESLIEKGFTFSKDDKNDKEKWDNRFLTGKIGKWADSPRLNKEAKVLLILTMLSHL